MSVAVIFPGQGTQQAGMANAWRDHPSWSVVERAEAALGEPLGHLVTDAPPEALARTREAQLAVLVTSLVAWDALGPLDDDAGRVSPATRSARSPRSSRRAPSASTTACASPPRRAELTQAAADAHPGRMAALLGATPEQAEDACSAAPDGCWVANDNAPGQVVIAGTPDGLEAASARAKELGVKRVSPLNVGGAFHTPLMQDATDGLATALADVRFAPPAAPVVSNGDARAYADADGWRERLARTCRCPCAGARPWTRSSRWAPRPSSKSVTARCSPRSRSAAHRP